SLLTPGEPATFEVTGNAAKSARWFGIYLLSENPAEPRTEDNRPPAIRILDDALPRPVREEIIREHRENSAEILRKMIVGIEQRPKEAYRRIPWIWRVTIAAGRRTAPPELRELLEISTPQIDAPLMHWQAVVIGGGLINGITQADAWPQETIDATLAPN